MQSVRSLLEWGKKTLETVLPKQEAAFEAAYLLCEFLDVDKSYLYTWPEKEVHEDICTLYQSALEKRKTGVPVAYILGYKEFWSMRFKVSEHTLIPRPETEVLVETVLQTLHFENLSLLELGTGTGAIACALARMRPSWAIQAVDLSESALQIANENVTYHQLTNIKLYQSNWFEKVPAQHFDAIVSNPPYVEVDSPHLNSDTKFEPALALFSGEKGLGAITHIIKQATLYLKPNGMLCVEHGFQQSQAIHRLLIDHGFKKFQTIKDYSDLDRVTIGYKNSSTV